MKEKPQKTFKNLKDKRIGRLFVVLLLVHAIFTQNISSLVQPSILHYI